MRAGHQTIAKRYAEALYQVAMDCEGLTEIEEGLKQVQIILKKNANYKSLIMPQIIPSKMKSVFLNSVISELNLNELVQNLLKLLIRNNRLFLLDLIIEEFFKSLLAHRNEVLVELQSAIEIPPTTIELIKKQLNEVLKKTIILKTIIKEELLGGVLISINSQMVDNTVKAKLNEIRRLGLQN